MSRPFSARARRLSLGLNVLAGLNALNAWRAFDRHGAGSIPAFAAGLPTSELPLANLAAHVGSNAIAARSGAFRGRLGLANAAVAATGATALIALERSTRRSAAVYASATVSSLGPDYREQIIQPTFPGAHSAVASTPGLIRMARVRRRFAHDHDLSYGPAGAANLLDIWRRDDLPRDGRAPVLIQVPGGAWTMGHKQGQAYPLMSQLAEHGWVCVAINYRLSPRSSWPDHIVDVKRAIAWVRDHIAGYGGDPAFIAISGGSAGGHLSSLAALTPHIRAWQPGFEHADTSVVAAVPFYGAYDWTDRDGAGHPGLVPHLEKSVVKATLGEAAEVFAQASPMSHVSADAPPFFISHGRNDSMIPVEQARLFAQRLERVSRSPVVYAELPHAQHAFDVLGSTRAKAAAEAASRFLGFVYGAYTRHPAR